MSTARVAPPPMALQNDDLSSVRVSARLPIPGREDKPFSISGDDLARALEFVRSYNNVAHALDGDDVNLQLRGLATVIGAFGSEGCDRVLDQEAAFFLEDAVRNLVARLECSGASASRYRVERITTDASKTAAA